MTIYLLTGTPGSGKSLDACRIARRHMKRGNPVISNFRIRDVDETGAEYYYVNNDQLTPGNLVSYATYYWGQGRQFKENQILLIVDECQLKWNSRLWNSDPHRMDWLEFMSQHRKFGYKILLVCQSDIMIDRQFRTLVEYEIKHKRVGNIGLGGKILKIFSFSELFYACEMYYGEKVKTDGYFFRYTKKLGSMYDTYTTFAQLDAGTA